VRSPFRRSSRQHIVNMMQRPSRLAGLFASLLLAALVLVTSGFACIAPESSQDMTAMGMTSAHADGQATAQNVAPVQKAPATPCKFPWAPDGCQSMVPCAQTALASAAAALNRGGPVPQRVASDAEVAPLSVTTPPELPPPRA
jgi:hypothetical protein